MAIVPDYWDNNKMNLTIREFFEDYEGNWHGTRTGIDLPYDLTTVTNLYIALSKLLAKSETLQPVLTHYYHEALKNANTETDSE